MSGSVGIIAQDSARYTMFGVSLTHLKHPGGTRIDWGLSTYVPKARNMLAQRALDDGADWILFLDDDHVFAPDLLMDLLAWEKPIVGGLYMQRAGSHEPVALNKTDGGYEPIDLTTLPGEGLLKVDALGAGALLVRSEVFRAISSEADWFSYGHDQAGWTASEDVIFCEKAAEAGFPIYVDLGSPVGHMAPSAIWPSFVDKEWCLGFSVSDHTKLYARIETKAVDAAADAVRR